MDMVLRRQGILAYVPLSVASATGGFLIPFIKSYFSDRGTACSGQRQAGGCCTERISVDPLNVSKYLSSLNQ